MTLSLQKAGLALIERKLLSTTTQIDDTSSLLTPVEDRAVSEKPLTVHKEGGPAEQIFRELTSNELREKIQLEDSEETDVRRIKIKIAELLAAKIKEEVERLNGISTKYYGASRKSLDTISTQSSDQASEIKDLLSIRDGSLLIFKTGSRTTSEKFKSIFNYVLQKYGLTEIAGDDEIFTLTAYKVTQDETISKMPDGLFDENTEARKGILVKHYLLDVKALSCARQVETLKTIKEDMVSAGLDRVFRGTSVTELLKLETVFGKHFQGDDPAIREWELFSTRWEGEGSREIAKKAFAWFLKHGIKVVRNDNTLDVEKIRTINWASALEEHDLRSRYLYCEHTPNVRKVIELGVEGLGITSPIGINGEPILPWEITTVGMWQEKDKETGRMLIDDVTDYLIGNLRKTNPELFLERDDFGNGKGELNPETASKFKWFEAYDAVASGCLTGSKMKAPEALARRLPSSFGWGKNQIKPYQIKIENMWQEEAGKKLFTRSLACAMRESGLGRFEIRNDELVHIFTYPEFEQWYNEVINGKYENDLHKFLSDYNLSGGYKVAAGSITKLIALLFSIKDDSITIRCRNGNELKETVKQIALQRGGQLTISFGKINEAQEAALLHEPGCRKTDFSLGKCWITRFENPLDDYGVSLKGRYKLRDRFSLKDSSFERILNDPSPSDSPAKTALNKMEQVLLSSSAGPSQYRTLEILLKSRRFPEQDLKEILTLISSTLDEFNIKSTSLKTELRTAIDETLKDPRGIKIVLEETIKESKRTQASAESIFCQASPLEALENILDFLGQAVINHKIRERLPQKE